MTRVRKEKFDNRRRVDMTDSQADWCEVKADEQGISFMAFIRKLINEKMKAEKGLSLNRHTDTTAIPGQNRAHPDGLYTAEQVAQLISAITERKK